MRVEDIRAFIPCKDYAISIAFYEEIGFSSEPVSEDLTLIYNGDCYAFLQQFYREDFAQNFMLQICVEDIQEAHSRSSNSVHKTKISAITNESWGKVFYLWGPSGELLHITELHH